MNTEKKVNLKRLIDAFIADVKESKKLNGNADHFYEVLHLTLYDFDGDIGERLYLLNDVKRRLMSAYDCNGKKITNWGYKKVIPFIEKSYIYINK